MGFNIKAKKKTTNFEQDKFQFHLNWPVCAAQRTCSLFSIGGIVTIYKENYLFFKSSVDERV